MHVSFVACQGKKQITNGLCYYKESTREENWQQTFKDRKVIILFGSGGQKRTHLQKVMKSQFPFLNKDFRTELSSGKRMLLSTMTVESGFRWPTYKDARVLPCIEKEWFLNSLQLFDCVASGMHIMILAKLCLINCKKKTLLQLYLKQCNVVSCTGNHEKTQQRQLTFNKLYSSKWAKQFM